MIGQQSFQKSRAMCLSAKKVSLSVRAPQTSRTISCQSMDQKGKVIQKVRTIIAEQLGSDKDEVTAESKFVDLGADSLDTVEIMMALEEEFDITLDEEGAERIATVEEAAEEIMKKMKKDD